MHFFTIDFSSNSNTSTPVTPDCVLCYVAKSKSIKLRSCEMCMTEGTDVLDVLLGKITNISGSPASAASRVMA